MTGQLKMALFLGALSAIPPLSIDGYISAFPLIGRDFNASDAEVQLSLTAMLLGLACGQFFIGPLSDIYGRKKPLIFSLAAFILASVWCAITNDIFHFVLLRFVQGLAGSGGVVISRAIAYDNYKGHMLTQFVALLMVITNIAPIMAPVIGGQIIALFSWHAIFLFLALCGVLLSICTLFTRESLPVELRQQSSYRSILNSFAVLFKNPPYLACLAVHCLVMGGLFSYISASPFILQVLYGFTPVQFSLMFAFNGFGMIVAAKTAAAFVMRFDERTQLKAVVGVYTVCGAVLAAASALNMLALWLIMLAFFVLTACISICECNSFSLAMQQIKSGAGSAAGLLGIAAFLFGSVMPPLMSLGGDISVYPLAVITFVTGVIALLAFRWIPRAD